MYARCRFDLPHSSMGMRCRRNAIIIFIIFFNFCVFFVHYEVVGGLWGVVGECDPFPASRNRSQPP